MKRKIIKYFYVAIALIFGLLFVAKFGEPAILKAYVKTGIGDCQTTPLLCIVPETELANPEIDKTYLEGLVPYCFPAKLLPFPLPNMSVLVPKGFSVIRGSTTKVYYKKKKFNQKVPIIYLLYQKPQFFPNLFPQLKKQGIKDNYQFLTRVMTAQFMNVNNLTDAFFVIMKSVFIPDLGNQKNVKMLRFVMNDRRGFIGYNLGPSENYFNCDIITGDDTFFKIYIKDKNRKLNLDNVLAIVSTLSLSNIVVK